MTTIVTALIINQNNFTVSTEGVEKYIHWADYWLKSELINKVVFVSQDILGDIECKNYPNIKLIPFDNDDLYYLKYVNSETKIPDYRNVAKDTRGFMLTILNKTKFVKRAIELNPFDSENFVWIDFGIAKVVDKITDTSYLIEEICKKRYDKVRMSVVIPFDYKPVGFIQDFDSDYNLNRVLWYFAGGVFGGPADKLLEFDQECEKEILWMLQKFNRLTWEVNVWYFMYSKGVCRDILDMYLCNHNRRILSCY